jgi:hypothetical protein
MADKGMMSLNYSRLGTTRGKPVTVGTISVQGTTLAVAGRAWDDVSSYFSGTQTTYLGYSVPLDVNAAEFRFQTTADADSHVVEIWGARGRDHMTLLATLTLTGGTQEADDDLYFVDTIVATYEYLPTAGVVSDSATNRICRYTVDLAGFDKLLFLASTLGSDSLAVQIGGY